MASVESSAADRLEFRILGPLEVLVDGTPARLGGPRQRALLALLLVHANEVVPATGWSTRSGTRTRPGPAATSCRPTSRSCARPWAAMRSPRGGAATSSRSPGRPGSAPLRAAQRGRPRGAGRGPAGARRRRVPRGPRAVARAGAVGPRRGAVRADGRGRLDELRLLALERRIEADLACGRDAELVGRARGAGRRAPAARALAGAADAGAVPLRASGGCARGLPRRARDAGRRARHRARAPRCATCSARSSSRIRRCRPRDGRRRRHRDRRRRAGHGGGVRAGRPRPRSLALAEPLARAAGARAGIAATVAERRRARAARAAPSGRAPRRAGRAGRDGARGGVHVAHARAPTSRLADEQDVELLVVDAPDGLLEDARARCAARRGAAATSRSSSAPGRRATGPCSCRSRGRGTTGRRSSSARGWRARAAAWLQLAGASTGAGGRDASRLLANASLAVQRVLGIAAEPLIVEPAPEALVAVARTPASSWSG